MVESLRQQTADAKRVEALHQFRRSLLERYTKCLASPTLPRLVSSVIKDAQSLGVWQPPEDPHDHNNKLLELTPSAPILNYGGFSYRPETREVETPSGERVELTPQESRIFHIFMEAPNRTIPSRILVKGLFDNATEDDMQNLRVLIGYLRGKIGDSKVDAGKRWQFRYINAVHAQGYRFSVEGATVPDITPIIQQVDTINDQSEKSDEVGVPAGVTPSGKSQYGVLEPYISFLNTRDPGSGGFVELDEGEKLKDVKRRLTTAAEVVGKPVSYLKSPKGAIIFQVNKPQV